MPSSRLYEMLADSLAKPSQPFQDFKALADAGDQTANSFEKYGEAKQGARKISDVLGDDSYGDMQMRDIQKNSALASLMEGRRKGGKKKYALKYDAEGNPSAVPLQSDGVDLEGDSDVIKPDTVNVYRGKEFDRNVNQDKIKNAKDAYTTAAKDLAAADLGGGAVLDPAAAASARSRKAAAAHYLTSQGIPGYDDAPAPQHPNAKPAPSPAAQGGQPVAGGKVKLIDNAGNTYYSDPSKADALIKKHAATGLRRQ